MDATDLAGQLCDAIRQRSLVMFEYGDLIRVVEPHRVGVNSAGHPMLSGWLRAGYSRSDPAGGWRNYLLTDVRALQVLAAPFAAPRPGYAVHDARMREVFCQLEAATSTSEARAESPYVVSEPVVERAPAAPTERAELTSALAPAEKKEIDLGQERERRRA
jgi:hypothetical protein